MENATVYAKLDKQGRVTIKDTTRELLDIREKDIVELQITVVKRQERA